MARWAGLMLVSMILQGQSVAPPATGRITGQVIDDQTKAPIADARVMLMRVTAGPGGPVPGPPPTVQTDQDGRFVFDELDAGSYRVNASKGGYAQAPANALVGAVDVRPGRAPDSVTIALQRGGAIAGRVIDANGAPVIEVRLSALRPQVIGSSATMPMQGQPAQTNDLGEFRIYGLPPGDYYVQAGGFATPPSTAPVATRLAPTFYPSAREAREGKPVTVVAGQTTSGIDIRMNVESVFQIRGVVVDDRGQPVEGAMVLVASASGTPGSSGLGMGRIVSRRDGSFVASNLSSGSYSITAARPIVIAGPAPVQGATGGTMVTGVSGGIVGGVTTSTQTRGGVTTTTQYRTDPSKSVPVVIDNANVTGLTIVAGGPR